MDWTDFQVKLDALKAANPGFQGQLNTTTVPQTTTVPFAPQPCPNCGSCPTCGRGGYGMRPYYPYPYYPTHPWREPWITWTATAQSTSTT